ncbi:hypothetical protein [Niabella drilacis]|uniref:Uncharacterized protein n=1 Tax=Niabella drilacis (strain DSM 25811 / CCM 8410 / CCUG 62505 / LMG 26954 / E90) TaxID=1285928 RepID=A0A1G6NBM9_NIADE|nr:hypothetical protein [Niabella drilacis]SDC64595.1 hypothetical protein SAMN04487894_103205 [Niabella drilacis]
MNYKKRGRRPRVFLFVLLGFLAILLFGCIVMLLWNAVLPDLLGTKQITYWQAVGLLVLSKIIFGFGHGGPRHHQGPSDRLRQKFRNMSEEERKEFREAWKQRCGQWRRFPGEQ